MCMTVKKERTCQKTNFAVRGCSWSCTGIFWLEIAVHEPPAGYLAKHCWFLGTRAGGRHPPQKKTDMAQKRMHPEQKTQVYP